MEKKKGTTLGLPRMKFEPGERRDFLPAFVRETVRLGMKVFVETGLGSGMGFTDEDYTKNTENMSIVDRAEAYAQDIVLMLRCPAPEEFTLLRPGSALVSMLHFPTRPERVQRLIELGLEAFSLDSMADDDGRRLVESLRDVAWNGVQVSFDVLSKTYRAFFEPDRPPIRVAVLGSGQVGKHAVEASLKYGDVDRNREYGAKGLPGVEVVAVGRNLSGRWSYMRDRFLLTDILVDATQRKDPSRPIVPNEWIAWLPEHAVICDLNVDPYLLNDDPPTVRSIEGIPQGNLDRYVFFPDDPSWSHTVPHEIPSLHRRTVVSCYSWPGMYPEPCMERYGRQLLPFFETLMGRGGLKNLRSDGPFFERALWRASLRRWVPGETVK